MTQNNKVDRMVLHRNNYLNSKFKFMFNMGYLNLKKISKLIYLIFQ